MIHTDEIDPPVGNIRETVKKIRKALPEYELPTIANMLDTIDESCSELANLEEGDIECDNPVFDMVEEVGLSALWDNYKNIDMGTVNDLKDAFEKIMKFHGYKV